ncbi:MAG: hypothetical protein HFF14_03350 [Angelakisella sp.]|jgi:regulatory protein|nr:hypothetical protein [Angelakisella sp.]
MTITQLQETKKGRFSVFADGEFLFSVHKDTFLLRPELAVGRQVTVETLEEIRLEDEALSCKEKALTLLEYSSHSAGRLAEKLRRHYPPETVEQVVQRLRELGLLDDLDYGRRLAADLLNLRGYSLGRVRQTLYQRRLDKETIDQVMGELSEIDQIAPIVALVNKKYLQKLREPRGREKVAAALQRRGYRYDEIREALSQVTEGLFDEGYEEEGEG